jgi:hypothetical protein
MANAIKWSALGTFTLAIAGDASSPTLKNLANGSSILGNELDWTTDRSQFGLWQLRVRGASAFSTNGYVALYFILAADGTNYEDGSTSVTPAGGGYLVFPVRAVSTQQIITIPHVLFPPSKFKPLIVNFGGQAMTNTNDENQLHYRAYSDEVQ